MPVNAASSSALPPLRFIVAPHIVQDLGLNLYTSLSRVLVEFVANAHDADASTASITMDKELIEKARKVVSAEFRADLAKHEIDGKPFQPLEERTLPDDITIIVQDDGHGMSRKDLQDKFLHAGRRRREEENRERSDKGRVVMGRKGLGKLAGFGVARVMTLTTREVNAPDATQIVLDYADLIQKRDTRDIKINDINLPGGGRLPKSGGTRIVLSKLFYAGTKNKLDTVERELGDHFSQINTEDFSIKLNDLQVEPTPRELIFAWPEPEKPVDEMVETVLQADDGRTLRFKYRIRFTARRNALHGKDRGVRIYAHNRLAAAASLLDADTNMHGFRMTDYMDGVVIADFIDEQPADYIATDRQALRWETPLLQPMYDFLSGEIKEACKQRQKHLDEESPKIVQADWWTAAEIKAAGLSKKHEKLAYKIASTLESTFKKGVDDDEYRANLPPIVRGLGHGGILTAISKMAGEERPDLHAVAVQITKLTAEELDHFISVTRGRLDGITVLRKICESAEFKEGNNESELHKLFNECPWLIDPTFFEFLASNQQEGTVFNRLSKKLKIANHISSKYDKNAPTETKPGGRNLRPDLVFLLGNVGLSRLVIVELKAPNTPLYGAHLRQLQDYMAQSEQYLANKFPNKPCSVQGILIGSKAEIESKATDVRWLNREIDKSKNQGQWRVFDILEVLQQTEDAHREILDADTASVVAKT